MENGELAFLQSALKCAQSPFSIWSSFNFSDNFFRYYFYDTFFSIYNFFLLPLQPLATSSLLPYLTIHMQSIGLTIEEIAIIYLALPFTTFLSPPLTGNLQVYIFFRILVQYSILCELNDIVKSWSEPKERRTINVIINFLCWFVIRMMCTCFCDIIIFFHIIIHHQLPFSLYYIIFFIIMEFFR